MKFDETIKKISAIVASVVVFLLASGTYLSFKGFVVRQDGQIVLMTPALAAEEAGPVKRDFENMRFPENHILGEAKAPVTLYEYSSLSCPHCADFHLDVLPDLKKDFIGKGKLKVIYADLPLDKKAMQASLLARCFDDSAKYYEFIGTVYKKQQEWVLAPLDRAQTKLVDYAVLNGLDADKAAKCLKDEAMAAEIADIRQQAIEKLKVAGTPSFVITNGKKFEFFQGDPDYAVLKQTIEDMINK